MFLSGKGKVLAAIHRRGWSIVPSQLVLPGELGRSLGVGVPSIPLGGGPPLAGHQEEGLCQPGEPILTFPSAFVRRLVGKHVQPRMCRLDSCMQSPFAPSASVRGDGVM